MSKDLGFVRKFIIFKKEFSNIQELNPKGHGRLVLRGNKLNISLNIENGERNNFYNVILTKGTEVYDLGKIFTDEDYSGKADFDLNYQKLTKRDFSIDKINGILLVRDSKILLGGYLNNEDGSIENYIEELKVKRISGKKDKLEQEDKLKIEEAEVREKPKKDFKQRDKKAEEKLDKSENKEIRRKVDKKADKKEPITSDINTKRKYDEIMSNMFNNTEEGKKDESKEFRERAETINYVLNILNFFPYIEPFKINLQGYNWWRIDRSNNEKKRDLLPYFSYVIGGNHKYPIIKNSITANDLINRYGHYIFGLYNINDEVKFYVYGIPGRFLKKDHPQEGNTGFNTWFEGRENYGYWLLYIEPTSGRIIHPVNPMIPLK